MDNKPLLIGVSGGSGSGKTTLIKMLRETFSEHEVSILSQDDYYKPRELQKEDAKGIKNFDLPSSIHKKQLLQDVNLLINGETVVRKEYTFNNEKKEADVIVIKPAPIIIVEGLFIFHFKKIRRLCDLKVFVQAKGNLKVIRRIKRDRIERNYPIEDVLYRYEHHVLPSFEKYIEPYRDQADIIINNNDILSNAANILIGFIRSKL